MVSSATILVKRILHPMKYHRIHLDAFFTKSRKVKVTLIVNSFLANGFR